MDSQDNQSYKNILINAHKKMSRFAIKSLIASNLVLGVSLGTALNKNFHVMHDKVSFLPWLLTGIFTLASTSCIVTYFKYSNAADKLKNTENFKPSQDILSQQQEEIEL